MNPGPVLKAFMLLSWINATVFLFGLPHWSYVFNDYLGYGKALCNAPAGTTICGNTKEKYLDLAKRLERHKGGLMEKTGHSYWGCSCGEGIFGDWACVVEQHKPHMHFYMNGFMGNSFSISYFITTPSATGLFTAVTFFPILFIWNLGAGNSNYEGDSYSVKFIFITQVAFQVFFGLFLFFTLCAFPKAHLVVVGMFILCEVAHMFAVACHIGHKTPMGRSVFGTCAVGVVGLTIGTIVDAMAPQQDGTWLQQHAFYLGECTGLVAVLAIPVILTVFFDPPPKEYAMLG